MIIKKDETLTENPPLQIYVKKKSIIVFKSKTSYKLALLTPETIKLLESIKKEVYKAKDSENVPKVESVEESVDTHQTFSLLLLQIKNSDS